MHALEVYINGKRICVAAPGDDGLVVSNLTLTGVLDKPGSNVVRFRIGGVRNEQHLEWFHERLSLNDVIEIRVVDTMESDPPVSVEPVSDGERERIRRASDYNPS